MVRPPDADGDRGVVDVEVKMFLFVVQAFGQALIDRPQVVLFDIQQLVALENGCVLGILRGRGPVQFQGPGAQVLQEAKRGVRVR